HYSEEKVALALLLCYRDGGSSLQRPNTSTLEASMLYEIQSFRVFSSFWTQALRACRVHYFMVLTVAMILAVPAKGASRFWVGSVNGNFSTAGNWIGSVAPAAGDDLVFQAGIT